MPQIVNVYLTSAAAPWTSNVYGCAPSSVAVKLTDPQSADIVLRVGQPENLNTPAYQLSTEEILVVANLKTGVGALTSDQVRALFLGQITNWKDAGGNDLPVQVWAYPSDADVQQVFEQDVMKGQPVTSQARLAVAVPAMMNSVETVSGSVGVVTRRLKSSNIPESLTVATVPVLAIVKSEPQGVIKELLSCLQASK